MSGGWRWLSAGTSAAPEVRPPITRDLFYIDFHVGYLELPHNRVAGVQEPPTTRYKRLVFQEIPLPPWSISHGSCRGPRVFGRKRVPYPPVDGGSVKAALSGELVGWDLAVIIFGKYSSQTSLHV